MPQVEVQEENTVTNMETENKSEQHNCERPDDTAKQCQFKSSLTQTKRNRWTKSLTQRRQSEIILPYIKLPDFFISKQ